MSPVQPQAIKCKSNLLFKLFHFIFVNFVTADTHRGTNGWTFCALIEGKRQTGALNRKYGSFEARMPVEGQRWCISEWIFSTLTLIEPIFCEASWIAQPFLPLCMNWPNDDEHFIIFRSYMQTALHTNDLMNFSSRTNIYSLLAMGLSTLLLLCVCTCTETAAEPKLIFLSAIFEWTGRAHCSQASRQRVNKNIK